MRLSESTLTHLPPSVVQPGFDRRDVAAGMVHFGVGGFHRAHQAMYAQRLMQEGQARDWGICGVGLMPGDQRMRDVLHAQDCLYTLVLKHPDGHQEREVIGSIVEYLYAPDDVEAVLEKLADPRTRIVSLTVTEGGYNFDPSTGAFDLEAPHIAADLAEDAMPSTMFGIVTEGLARRRERGIAPFTVMSCDNLQGNGHVTKSSFVSFANAKDADLGAWIESSVSFPNTMVDRITPVTSQADRDDNDAALGMEDGWPVVAEPFIQWVIEDSFTLGRPDWGEVGAQFVVDVMPYELMKLRLLNCDHQAMCYFGYLGGYRYAHEAMSDERIVQLLRRYMDREATPTLREVPGIDLDQYKDTLIERFSNPHVKDTLARLCAESSDRIPKWLVPVIRERLAAGESVVHAAAIVASWARYAEGIDEDGEPIEVVDNLKEEVMAAAARQDEDPLAFVRDPRLFVDIADHEAFTRPYLAVLSSLHERGSLATLDALLAGDLG